jgi:DHA1 family inner membrane transport protein
VLARPQVQLGLLMTVLGFGGVFAVFTYIQPILTELAGLLEGSRLADPAGVRRGPGGRQPGRRPLGRQGAGPALLGSLAILTLVLVASAFGFHDRIGAVVAAFGLGAAAFATVAPLQMRVLSQAGGAGQGLASSLNIAAFNLGNAFGAWLGGAVIAHGPGLAAGAPGRRRRAAVGPWPWPPSAFLSSAAPRRVAA